MISMYKALLPPLISAAITVIFPLPLSDQANRCWFLLLLSGIWWVIEPFPAYVTSLLIVPAVVVGGMIPPTAERAGEVAISSFFDSSILLFISGFSIAAIFDKYKITQKISEPFLRIILKSKSDFGLYISLSIFCLLICCVVSNVAGSVLATAVGQQVSRQLHLDGNSRKRIVLTIAYCCNIGGMLVPIASPQNIIAIAILKSASKGLVNINFFQWVSLSIPFCIASTLVVYLVLRTRYGVTHRAYSSLSVDKRDAETVGIVESESAWTAEQVLIVVISGLTVIGWCLFESFKLNKIFGNMGILGITAVVVFHMLGLLNSHDWQSLPWPVLALLGGGMTLGQAVESSGLLGYISSEFSTVEMPSWVLAVIFYSIIALISNFLSSTVCAIITIPVIAKVGLSHHHGLLFVIPATFMISGAMGLPVSSFPNANAAAVVDHGKDKASLLTSNDFISTGFIVGGTLLAILCTGIYWLGLVLGY
jgi:phosphate transporter